MTLLTPYNVFLLGLLLVILGLIVGVAIGMEWGYIDAKRGDRRTKDRRKLEGPDAA